MKTLAMKSKWILYTFASVLVTSKALAVPHHRLEVLLTPALKSLTVTDHISSLKGKTFRFRLNKNLKLQVLSPGDALRPLPSFPGHPYQDYELQQGPGDQDVTLQYSGMIFDPVMEDSSSGLISADGAVLFGSSYWLPDFFTTTTFEITRIQQPSGWTLASPGAQREIPQQEIFLIAGPFYEFTMKEPLSGLPLQIYLRRSEPELAQKFLSLLPNYLQHFQKRLGPYPYESFAVVENFWETGFGMPAFTLLGPGVLRLPYILNSSFPHELLHNWWGNSVYVDYQRGNWCEGLTTYLADHWQQEVLKADRDYRLQSLINFQDYTKSTPDFPLREFKQRFNLRSQAIGYGKGMMFFHMLKKRVGEKAFEQGLKNIYRTYLGQSISYEEIEKSFEEVSGDSLKSFFHQWLDRTGAPGLELTKVQRDPISADKFKIHFELQQKSRELYELFIPVRFTLEDGSIRNEGLTLQKRNQTFDFVFSSAPQKMEIDPEVDVFRDLHPRERPWSFSNVFGSRQIWILGTDEKVQKTYLQTWKKSLEASLSLGEDSLLRDLPTEGSIVLLGDRPEYENLMLRELQGQDWKLTKEDIMIFSQAYAKRDHSTALVARSAQNPGLIFAWIRGADLESLAPRLLHFGKYGILVFKEKSLPLKATWPLVNSPLKVEFPSLYSFSGTN